MTPIAKYIFLTPTSDLTKEKSLKNTIKYLSTINQQPIAKPPSPRRVLPNLIPVNLPGSPGTRPESPIPH